MVKTDNYIKYAHTNRAFRRVLFEYNTFGCSIFRAAGSSHKGGEQDVGQYKDTAQDVLEGVDPGVRAVCDVVRGQPDAQRDQQELGRLFIEGILGLYENQGIKTPPFLFRGCFFLRCLYVIHVGRIVAERTR